MKKSVLFVLFAVLAVIFSGCSADVSSNITISSFEECVKAGYPVMESYPRQCSDGTNSFTESVGLKEECVVNNGHWIDSVSECEGISEEICVEMEGKFVECGSACRNSPEAQVCTMQCVAYCSFEEEN